MNKTYPSPPVFTESGAAAGQLLLVGFDGTTYNRSLAKLYKQIAPAGLILFSRNIESREQVTRLTSDLVKLSEDCTGRKPFICIDQEGGRVARLSADFPAFPPARALAADGSLELIEENYRAIGEELAAIGVTVNFAPVLDLNSNEKNPIIGDRSFSADPQKVAAMGKAAIRGLRRAGVMACGKHFPGHGDTLLDSHLHLPHDPRPASRFDDAELVPFRMAIEEEVEFIMTAHVVYPAFDATLPATLSPKIVTDLLREKMRYNGIITGDDMDMKAITDRYGDDAAARMAITAGVDMLLVCHEGERRATVHAALREMIERGDLPDADLAARLARIANQHHH